MSLDQTLQKKFIKTSMAAISILIFVLLGGVNIANFIAVHHNIYNTLTMIGELESMEQPVRKEETEPPRPFFSPKNDEDRMLATNFFVVTYDKTGKLSSVDTSRIASLNEEDAKTFADSVKNQEEDTVRIKGKYRYYIKENSTSGKRVLIFLDASDEMYSGIRTLIFSISIGALCLISMYLLVRAMSKKAIQPIAENIARQKQFVTNAGHEIKTPLAIIQANTEALELYQGESKWSKNIRQQIKRLDGLTKNLLYLARMDESAMGQKMQKETVNLSRLAEESTAGFQELMKKHRLTLEAAIESDISLQADREQMTQLLYILFDNACKYARKKTKVTLKLWQEGNEVNLSLSNICEKMPAVLEQQLFDRFYRADEARTQKTGGYGIGLSVAKGIVDAHDGTIEARYLKEEEIVFKIRLPKQS